MRHTSELVVLLDTGGNCLDRDAHELVVLLGNVKVEVFDVNRHGVLTSPGL
jgi:hypothetical protein